MTLTRMRDERRPNKLPLYSFISGNRRSSQTSARKSDEQEIDFDSWKLFDADQFWPKLVNSFRTSAQIVQNDSSTRPIVPRDRPLRYYLPHFDQRISSSEIAQNLFRFNQFSLFSKVCEKVCQDSIEDLSLASTIYIYNSKLFGFCFVNNFLPFQSFH